MKLRAGKAVPYLTVDGDAVDAGEWGLDGESPMPKFFREWDPATDLRLSRDLTLDGALVAKQCELAEAAELHLGVVWVSDSTRLRGSHSAGGFELGSGSVARTVSFTVPGQLVGGRLSLETVLWVRGPAALSQLSASRVGDVLWSDRKSITLEGDASRFPITVVDFSTMYGIDRDAFWMLSWPRRDFNEPFGASIRLLVNSLHPEVIRAVSNDGDLAGGLAIRRHLQVDVARSLIDFALGSDEFVDAAADFEEGSVGFAVNELIRSSWGSGMDPATLKASRASEPQAFESVLQARVMNGIRE